MIDKQIYENYIQILRNELVPAMGCTEPIAIAYAAAKARSVLGEIPEHISVRCSGNIIKNVKGVIVPNSGGLKGMKAAAVLGVVGGDPGRKLEVLNSVKKQDIEKTKQDASKQMHRYLQLDEFAQDSRMKGIIYIVVKDEIRHFEKVELA